MNACFDLEGNVVDAGPDVYDDPNGPCTEPYPMGDDPRTAAGAPLSNDILNCSMQTVDDAVKAGVYGVELTPSQIASLEAVFPNGVCDWTVPGIGQVALGDPWQSFD